MIVNSRCILIIFNRLLKIIRLEQGIPTNHRIIWSCTKRNSKRKRNCYNWRLIEVRTNMNMNVW